MSIVAPPTRPSAVTDPARLTELAATGLLDSPPEEAFDRLTRLAAAILDAPVAAISLVTDTRQFFKSHVGLTGDAAAQRQTSLDLSFCRAVVDLAAPVVVPDAAADPDWRDHPAVRTAGVVAYLGVPLVGHAGLALGSFCAVDARPRAWTARDLCVIRDLAALCMSEIELRQLGRRLHQDYLDLRTLQFARDDTAQMLVHDLRNPLTSVIGGLELLLSEGTLTPRQRQYGELAAQGAESLVHLVSAVLDTQKADVGKLGLDLRPQSPAALAAAAGRQVSGAAASRRVALEVAVPAELPAVTADAEKVRRVLVNLLSNAVQHTPAGGRVRVGGWAAGGAVTLEVADTGAGIPPHVFARLFERFGAADTTSRGKVSSGLGLAFSRAVIEAHGGRVWAESVLGQGTSFWFTLPVA